MCWYILACSQPARLRDFSATGCGSECSLRARVCWRVLTDDWAIAAARLSIYLTKFRTVFAIMLLKKNINIYCIYSNIHLLIFESSRVFVTRTTIFCENSVDIMLTACYSNGKLLNKTKTKSERHINN